MYFCNLRICSLRTQLFFADIKLTQICKYINFILTDFSLKRSHSNLDDFWFLGQFWVTWHLVVKKIFLRQCESGSETLIFLPCKFEALRFADWFTKEICGFAVCGLIMTNLRICDLRNDTSQTFVDLRLRNEPKKLWITNKFTCPPLQKFSCKTVGFPNFTPY
jgi:hypothetical protein